MEDRCTLKFQKSHKLTKSLGNKFWHVHRLDIFFPGSFCSEYHASNIRLSSITALCRNKISDLVKCLCLEILKLCSNMDHLFVLDDIIHNNRAYLSQSPTVRSQPFTTQKGSPYERQIRN